MTQEWHRGEYTISTDHRRLDLDLIHDFLTDSYWAAGRSLAVVRKSIEHSLPFGVYRGMQQIGFARVITDYATYAYLSDVFILEPFRGQGLGQWLVEVIVSHPELQGLRKWTLATADAHILYRKFGFTETRYPERYMEKWGEDF
jgi:GNAT superfamily N-acetyltransferase